MIMKRAFILFWKGLTGILSGIASWITVILGMKDESRYGKFIRRVVGSCFALLMLLVTIAVLWDFCRTTCRRLDIEWGTDDDRYYTGQYLSRNATYYSYDYGDDGYVRDADGNKTLENVRWIAKPLGNDSLVCYSDGRRRGYFNMYTGKAVIGPQYDHAWVFSDGLASVDDEGWIKFIDQTGKVVIDKRQRYVPGMEGYVFHDGLCVVHNNRRDRVGIIDRTGTWLLQPEYFSIRQRDSLLVVDNGVEEAVLTVRMETLIPFTRARHWISDRMIYAAMDDHSVRTYDMQGNVTEDFYISEVERMTYQTDELRYGKTKIYDDDGRVTGETDDTEPFNLQATAKCMRYQAEIGWYGLMSADGHVITPPSYSMITAVGPDLYLCETPEEYGILLDGRGIRVK